MKNRMISELKLTAKTQNVRTKLLETENIELKELINNRTEIKSYKESITSIIEMMREKYQVLQQVNNSQSGIIDKHHILDQNAEIIYLRKENRALIEENCRHNPLAAQKHHDIIEYKHTHNKSKGDEEIIPRRMKPSTSWWIPCASKDGESDEHETIKSMQRRCSETEAANKRSEKWYIENERKEDETLITLDRESYSENSESNLEDGNWIENSLKNCERGNELDDMFQSESLTEADQILQSNFFYSSNQEIKEIVK